MLPDQQATLRGLIVAHPELLPTHQTDAILQTPPGMNWDDAWVAAGVAAQLQNLKLEGKRELGVQEKEQNEKDDRSHTLELLSSMLPGNTKLHSSDIDAMTAICPSWSGLLEVMQELEAENSHRFPSCQAALNAIKSRFSEIQMKKAKREADARLAAEALRMAAEKAKSDEAAEVAAEAAALAKAAALKHDDLEAKERKSKRFLESKRPAMLEFDHKHTDNSKYDAKGHRIRKNDNPPAASPAASRAVSSVASSAGSRASSKANKLNREAIKGHNRNGKHRHHHCGEGTPSPAKPTYGAGRRHQRVEDRKRNNSKTPSSDSVEPGSIEPESVEPQ